MINVGDSALRWTRAKAGEQVLEHRQHRADTAGPDRPIPERLELLPSSRIANVPQPICPAFFGPRPSKYCWPTVELPIGTPVALLQGDWLEAPWAVHDVTRVIERP